MNAIIILMILTLAMATMDFGKILNVLMKPFRKLPVRRSAGVFNSNNYINSKTLFLEQFGEIPSSSYVGNIDMAKAFAYLRQEFQDQILQVHQENSFNTEECKQEFEETVIVMREKIVISLRYSWATIFYTEENYDWMDRVIRELSAFRRAEKEQPFEINIITANSEGLTLKPMPLKQTDLAIDLFYNDDFKPVDAVIKDRLMKEQDKGIVLLHGLPGTGKTSYLRHLVGSVKKKVLFVSPSVAGNLMNPDFIDLLMDNPNSILVIEDAENIMMDRKFNSDSSVSNLLNISDGLLSDCLNVQLICTFNSSLNLIDPALMRKGRLIARYEFGKLSVEKSRVLSKTFGFDAEILRPMTVAEIANQHEVAETARKEEVIGFRRQEELMN
jgi:SpoVK/Ycf46/Vps4 family AAA+-type ATPase